MKNNVIYTGGEAVDRIFRALGDPHRIQIIELLRERELSAGEILAAIDVVQSTLSHHMKTLADSGAVRAVRRGKWTYYSLNEENLEKAAEFLSVCAEGTRIRRQASSAETSEKTRRTSSSASVSTAEKTTEKPSVAFAAKTEVRSGEKPVDKDTARDGKKKDKKSKKSKKSKK